jgi:hypothetical protein
MPHLVDLEFDWKAVRVPPKLALDIVPCLMCVAAHHVLDGASKDVPVVRLASGEWRSVNNVGETVLLLVVVVVMVRSARR